MEEYRDINISDIRSLENIRARVTHKDVAELMESIRQHGLLQPIGVCKLKNEDVFVVVYGNRRLVACEKLGYKTIKAKILEEVTTQDFLILNTIENIQRKEVNAFELGRICNMLRDMDLSVSEISVRLSIPQTKVKGALDIYQHVPEALRDKVAFMKDADKKRKQGKIPVTVANYIISLRRQNFGEDVIDKLFSLASKEALTFQEFKVIGSLLESGMGLNKAVKEVSKYHIVRIDIPVNEKEWNRLMEVNGFTRKNQLIRALVSGEVVGNKKLSF